MADLAFTNYAFPAAGTPTARTMPVRLAEVKNVLDFGAYPDGTNAAATRAAIQAAVDANAGPNRGTIYFPVGLYRIDAPITYNYNGNLSICFRGEVGTNVEASGGFAGYVFDRALGTPNNTPGGRVFERIGITNVHASGGGIRMGSTLGGVIRDCGFNTHVAITTEDAPGVSSKNIHILGCQFGLSSSLESGSHYIIIGGGGAIQNCNLTGCETAVRAYGSGLHVSGNRHERCATTYLLGKDSANNAVGLTGFAIVGGTFEGNWIAFDLAGPCNGFFIGSHHIMGHDFTNAGVQTPSAHGTTHGIRIAADCAKNGVFSACDVSSWMETAGVQIANSTTRANVVFEGFTSIATGGGGVSWILPTNAYTASFEKCNVAAVWTFAQLPSGGNVFEGDEFDISDSATNPTGNWGATVSAGGSSNRCRVRWNGTVWTIMGK